MLLRALSLRREPGGFTRRHKYLSLQSLICSMGLKANQDNLAIPIKITRDEPCSGVFISYDNIIAKDMMTM